MKVTGQLRTKDVKNYQNHKIDLDQDKFVEQSKNDDNERYEIESATITETSLGHKILSLECKSHSGSIKELNINTGGLLLDGQNKELYELKKNGETKMICGIIRILGEVNNLELVEEIVGEHGRIIRRIIEGTVHVKNYIQISENQDKSAYNVSAQAETDGPQEKKVQDNENLIEAKGNLICEFNEETLKHEIYEEYFDLVTNKKSKTLLDVNTNLSKLITHKTIVEHIMYDSQRQVEIIRPIKGDLFISRDETGCKIVEKMIDKNSESTDAIEKETFKPIVGIVRILTPKMILNYLSNDNLYEEWLDEEGCIRRREIYGELEVFTKENGELSLRENFFELKTKELKENSNFNDGTELPIESKKLIESRIIHGVIKSFGDGKQILVDEYTDPESNLIRREICGV